MLAFSAASVAFAMAERTQASIGSAARLCVYCNTASASLTFLPRIMSMTSRAFCGDPRKYFALALASMSVPLLLRDLRRLLGLRPRVALERARRRELAELVPDHVLRDVDRKVALAIVDGKRQPDHLRRDRRAPRPGLDRRRPARALADAIDRLLHMIVNERALLYRTCHLFAP